MQISEIQFEKGKQCSWPLAGNGSQVLTAIVPFAEVTTLPERIM